MSDQRWALALSYVGAAYHGWQTQEGLPSVQTVLESALSRVANHSLRVQCAGRTDAGVHASEQIVHFDTPAQRDERAWIMGTNSYLPPDISVHWVKSVPSHFNARHRAISRRYRYLIYNASTRPGLLNKNVTWHYRSLDAERMQAAAQHWLGRHDFSSFRDSHCQSKTPVRQVEEIHVIRQGALIVVEIKANAFLHHMVRNMVGVLLEVGEGAKEIAWAAEVLEARARTAAAMTAPPHGLYLVKVEYSSEFKLPETPLGPFFLPDNLI